MNTFFRHMFSGYDHTSDDSPGVGASFSLTTDRTTVSSSLIDPCALMVPASVTLLPNIELGEEQDKYTKLKFLVKFNSPTTVASPGTLSTF